MSCPRLAFSQKRLQNLVRESNPLISIRRLGIYIIQDQYLVASTGVVIVLLLPDSAGDIRRLLLYSHLD